MVAVALAFAVIEIGGSVAEVGLVLACDAVALIACLLVGGVVADRVSRRAAMVSADVVRIASQGAMAALLLTGVAEVWMVALLAAVTGGAGGFFQPAAVGLMPAVVPPERLQRANGLRSTVTSIGEIAGPLVAGIVVAAASAGWAIAADALTYAISAAFLLRLRPPAREPRAAAGGFLADLRDGWRAVTSRTWIWALIGVTGISNLGWGAMKALGPVVADRDLGGAAVWGAVYTVMGVGVLAGSLLATAVDPRRPLVVYAVGGAAFGLPLAMLATSAPVPLLAAAAAVAGTQMALGNSVWESTLQRHIPSAQLSRVSSYDWFASGALSPVGMAIWGPIALAVGFSAALWSAAGLLVVTSLGLLAVPQIRRLGPFPTSGEGDARSPRDSGPSSPARAR
jgi:Major Facilitator Superfamily